MDGGAIFDSAERYRYSLWRVWEPTAPRLAVVMLDPSTGTAQQDDPTIRRVVAFARSWGFGSVEVVNLFALRATSSSALARAEDPVGKHNNEFLGTALARAAEVLAAWGNGGRRWDAADRFLPLLNDRPAACLGLTKLGQPRHPLYVAATASRIPWRPG